MLSPRLLVAAVALAGCAAPASLDAPADPFAAAAAAPTVLAADAPPPVARPDLPAVLRPDAAPGAHVGSHGAMSHGHSAHAPMADGPPAADPDPSPFTDALDAYLALHDALAADRLDPAAAATFAAAFAVLAETPPPGDPHFWHMRAGAVAAVRSAASALAETADLAAARAAFGALSAPFATLAEAHGLPDGYALVRHACGMADVAEGGVWLQRPGAVENPFFGAAMPTCGVPDAHDSHDGHGAHESHGAMGEGTGAGL